MKKRIASFLTLIIFLITSIFNGIVFTVFAEGASGVRLHFDGEVKNEGDTENFVVTQTGGVSYIADRTGKQNSAVRFTDGGGIQIKSSQGEVSYTGDFSVAMWIKPAYIEADTPIIGNMNWYQDGSWAQQGWQLYFDTTTKGIVFYAVGMNEEGNPTQNGCVRNLGALPYHEWTHIAVVFNSSEKQAYYYENGALTDIMNIDAEVWNFNAPINQTGETKLGNNGSKEDYKKSDVAYDEFILEQRAMDAEEIHTLGRLETPDPQMTFSFEDVIRDEASGKEYTPVNGKGESPAVSYMENGVDGKAIMMGNTDHIDLGELDWDKSFTVSMWINPQDSQTDSPIMGNLNWEKVAEGGWIFAFAGNSLPTALRFTAKQDNGERVDMRSAAEIPRGQWTHIALSCDREAGIAKLYINGILDQQLVSDGLKGGSLQTVYHTRIGQDGTGAYRTDKAAQIGYDNIKIFPGVLNEKQIREAASPRGLQAFTQGQFHFDGQHDNSVPGGFTANPWNGFDEKQPEFIYADGRDGQAVRFTNGDHFDISGMDYENSFSIAAWIKASENPTDCPIIGNINWNNVAAGGWLLAFPGGGLPNRLKFVVKQDNTERVNITTNAEIPKDIWTHIAVCYDRAGGRVKIYINGVLDQDVTDEKLKGGSLASGLAVRLGQDGTGVYAPNTRMDLTMDELYVYKKVLNDTEIEDLVLQDCQPRFDFCWVAGEQATADSYYTANLHVLTPEDYSRYSKVEFDVHFDPEKMQFDHSAMHNFGFSVDTSEQASGILHCKITPERSFAANTVREYSGSRAAKFTFSVKAEAQGSAALEIPQDSIKLKNKSAADVTAQTEIHVDTVPIDILQPRKQDKNKDGVVGIGDVAMAQDQREAEEIAAQAEIYPYKRVLMIVLDGAGIAFAPDAYHYTKDGEELGRFGVDGYADIRNNPYTIDLINNRCATTFTMQTVHPSWSAPNYTAFLHGIRVYGNSAANPFYCSNEEAGARYFYQYDAEDGSDKPSIFKVLKKAMPERTLYSTVQWESINSGIIEPNLGIGTQSAPNDRQVTDHLIEYINSSKMKNTALTFVQWDDVDHAGHSQGFFTDAYYEEVARHDSLYKEVVDTLHSSGYEEDTLVIFTADHGGYETGHGEDLPCTRNTMFSVMGQTVEPGRRLNDEGDTSDAPAVILNALRRDELKPDSMKESNHETGSEPSKESTAFDPNMFMSQRELSGKGRKIERLTLSKETAGAELSISQIQAGNDVTAVQAVIALNGAENISVTPAADCRILSQEITDGKLNLIVAKNKAFLEGDTIAYLNGEGRMIELYEAMLGTEGGKEIYCDIVSQEGAAYTAVFYNEKGEEITDLAQAASISAALSVNGGAEQEGKAVLAAFRDGTLCGISIEEVTVTGTLQKMAGLSEAVIKQADSVKLLFWDKGKTMKPLMESKIITRKG